MTHTLASPVSLHDGGGIFTLVWSILVISFSLPVVLNYRGAAGRMRWGRGARSTSPPMKPVFARLFAGFFLAAGLVFMVVAIHRFAQGGY